LDKTIIIIPTYNEAENIHKILDQIFGLNLPGLDVLFVDDNSPDGTAKIINERMKRNGHLFLITRDKKRGLGTAYVEGFKYAIQNEYDLIFEMDADLSHDPHEIPAMLEAAQEADLVIASRYINGVRVLNWPLSRLLLSVSANKYTQLITGLPIRDCTGGFKCFRRKVLEEIPLEKVKSNGYSFQIEMNYKAWKRHFIIKEVPMIFYGRIVGKSKMTTPIKIEALVLVLKLKLLSLLGIY